jgi:hypothetical protein
MPELLLKVAQRLLIEDLIGGGKETLPGPG